jgi:hypothetical protein
MGINIYFVEEYKEEIELESQWIHIGKSSAGWYFSLHIYPLGIRDDDINVINNWDDWKAFINSSNGKIYTEDHYEITFEQLRSKVEDRKLLDVQKFKEDTLKQLKLGIFGYDKNTNLLYITNDRYIYEHGCESIGNGPWCCSKHNFS